MRPTDGEFDPVLAELRELRTYDVSAARAERLRARCHSGLTMPGNREPGVWQRAVHAVVGAWCLVYVFETIRRAAAVYRF